MAFTKAEKSILSHLFRGNRFASALGCKRKNIPIAVLSIPFDKKPALNNGMAFDEIEDSSLYPRDTRTNCLMIIRNRCVRLNDARSSSRLRGVQTEERKLAPRERHCVTRCERKSKPSVPVDSS